MVSLDISPTGFVFTRNPVKLVFKNHGRATYSVSVAGNTFDGVVDGDAVINLSELLEAMVPDCIEPHGDDVFFTSGDVGDRFVAVSVTSEADGTKWETGFYAIKGGVSRQNYRLLANAGTDAFQSRFLSGNGNFFMTTRTHSWRIVMRETEICPLAFISAGDNVEVRELVGGNTCSYMPVKDALVFLDINALRRRFFIYDGVLPNLFDVSVGGRFACRIVVENMSPALERYTVKFRNSLGVFEVIDLPGSGKFQSSFAGGSDDDSGTFQKYDALIDDFSKIRNRVRRIMELEVSTIVPGLPDMLFLCDMLASDEVWLLHEGCRSVKVIPSAEGLSFPSVVTAPVTVSVKFLFSEDDLNLTPCMNSVSDNVKPRVFSDEFSKTFN